MNLKYLGIAAIMALGLANAAQAATRIMDGHRLWGAKGVVVEGMSYDVDLVPWYSTTPSIPTIMEVLPDFPGAASPFSTLSQAQNAMNEFFVQVIKGGGAGGDGDRMPLLSTWGYLGHPEARHLIISQPYGPMLSADTSAGVTADIYVYMTSNPIYGTPPGGHTTNASISFSPERIVDFNPEYNDYENLYAIWSVSAVPEPETYAMLVAGLGVVGLSVRRRCTVTAVAAA